MRENVGATTWRLAVFMLVCLFGMFALFAIFSQLRFQAEQTYKALFSNVTGLQNGHFVRIAGVEVGKVKKISIEPDASVLVEFSADDSVVLTQGTRAARPLRRPDRRTLSRAKGRRRQYREAPPRRHYPADPYVPGTGSGCTHRWIPPVVPRAGPRPGQRAVRPADPGLPGPGRHDWLRPVADRRVDRHAGRPRSADRRGDHQPQHPCSARWATTAANSPKASTRCRNL